MGLTPEQDREITRLYEEMFQNLRAYANSALNDWSLAEEAAQDTFRIACAKPDELLGSPNPKGWLTNTLKNVIQNIRRSQIRWNNLTGRLISLAELRGDTVSFLSSEDDIALNEIGTIILGNTDWRMFRRVAVDGFTMAETAREFGLTTEACKKRIHRNRVKLQDYIKNNT